MHSLLHVQGLTIRFAPCKPLLKDVSFRIEKGESVWLKGANGTGKTTLLKVLAHVIEPTTGEILVAGKSLKTLKPQERKRVAWMPTQENSFPPFLTGLEGLRYWQRYGGVSDARFLKLREEFSGWPTFVEALQTPYYLCSSGMKQALSVARAFLSDPDLVLLDEPLRGLDHTSVAWLLYFFRKQAGVRSLLITSHYPHDDSWVNRHLEIRGGALV